MCNTTIFQFGAYRQVHESIHQVPGWHGCRIEDFEANWTKDSGGGKLSNERRHMKRLTSFPSTIPLSTASSQRLGTHNHFLHTFQINTHPADANLAMYPKPWHA